MLPEDVQTAAQAGSLPLVSPQAGDGPNSSEPFTEQGEKESTGPPGSQLLLQHKREQGALGISRKGGVGCKHIDLRMSIGREEHFYVG